jgi:hypothetical protein
MVDITPENLIELGYKEYQGFRSGEERRFFQKRFDDKQGICYFLNFREWYFKIKNVEHISIDAEIRTETDTGGTLILVINEKTIDLTEKRALDFWIASGANHYEKNPY